VPARTPRAPSPWPPAALLACVVAASASHVLAQSLPPPLQGVGFEVAFGHLRFDRPLWVGHPGDGSDRIFVVEQDGRIYAFANDASVRAADLVLDIHEKVYRRHNEEGLLGLAFHPRVAENGVVFLHYSAKDPRRGVIARFSMNADRTRILPETEEVVLEVEQPWGNHNGGCLQFGPDGYLYASFGDGGSGGDPRGNGQNRATLLGTILRIDVDHGRPYAIPPDNPFVAVAGARPEIWAYGLRNVWRFSFDRGTGDLWAADVGQDRWEEVDLVVAGGNYGWNLREGAHPFRGNTRRDGLLDPVVDYDRKQAQSITGGLVYRGRRVPALAGGYVHGDYVTGFLWVLWWDGSRVTRHATIGRAGRITSFGEDRSGELLFTSFDGRIYRLVGE
jgi:glucose/arabinose dehydrogenase